MSEPLRVLSLGAGVQSSTVLLMSCVGELPKLDHAIFADTGWEPTAVYAHLDWLESVAAEHGISSHRVSKGNLRADLLRGISGAVRTSRWATLPFFVLNPDGSQGMVRRQCTSEYKSEVIDRKLRELIGLAPRQHAPRDVRIEQWFGISADEAQRMRVSAYRWIRYRYPLIYDAPKRMRRHDCLAWIKKHGYPEPPRSACIGCPFRSDREWRDMRDNRPDEWAEAVEFDRLIRHQRDLIGQAYLHRSCVPLDEVDLRTAEERGQLNLWDNECAGVCGV